MLTIPQIIMNVDGTYEGNLQYYFKKFMQDARNLNNSYHNFRHIFHVLFLCHDACEYYRTTMPLRHRRNLMIAALYHDFDHPGRTGNDDLNIEMALRGLRKHIHRDDQNYLETISAIIRTTEYPPAPKADTPCLEAQILRDADASQSLSVAWIQQVIFGLGSEMGIGWVKVLKMQESFLANLKFSTLWAQEEFPQTVILEKIAEAKKMIALLEE